MDTLIRQSDAVLSAVSLPLRSRVCDTGAPRTRLLFKASRLIRRDHAADRRSRTSSGPRSDGVRVLCL